jgi:hypothetical protein
MMNQVEDRSMQVPVPNRTLLRSLMAASMVLLGASACSRSDRAETGSDNSAATMQDTAVTRATQDVPGTGQDRMATDTTNPVSENTGTGAAAGDTAPASVKSDAPRAATAPSSAERQRTSRPAPSGSRATTRDTAAVNEDSARVTEDTSETSLNQGDTSSVAGYSEMARDTTGGVDQIDTTASAAAGADVQDTTMNAGRVRPVEDSTETMGQVTTDTGNVAVTADTVAGDAAIAARGADTTGNAGRIRPPEDSTEMQGNIDGISQDTAAGSVTDTAANAAAAADVQDTTMNAGRVRPVEDSTETMGQVTTDTGSVAAGADTVAGDAAIAARGADTTGNAGRIRPPEDSTEMQGNASSAESASVNAADTADEAPVASEARESDTADRETQVASENRAEDVGAAAIGGTVTGADAVAMMTRAGQRCNVVNPESDEEVRWDMSSTPSTLNPCGLGSMNLSKVWTASQRGE